MSTFKKSLDSGAKRQRLWFSGFEFDAARFVGLATWLEHTWSWSWRPKGVKRWYAYVEGFWGCTVTKPRTPWKPSSCPWSLHLKPGPNSKSKGLFPLTSVPWWDESSGLMRAASSIIIHHTALKYNFLMIVLLFGGCGGAAPWLNPSKDVLQGGVSGGASPHFSITWAVGEGSHFLNSIFKCTLHMVTVG